MRWLSVLMIVVLAGCGVPPTGPAAPSAPESQTQTAAAPRKPSTPTGSDVSRFNQVVARVEPVAENLCRKTGKVSNCDFKIVVDNRRGQPANAYQTVDGSGRPILAFTLAMLADVNNSDELAFVMGHEAAHHIAGHLPRQQQNAMAGAIILGGLASLAGAGSGAVDAALDLGANVGARSYSKDFELEADAIGTVITRTAGFDPVRGARFFTRIPDPGDRFLGTHPPNNQRIETVRRVNDSLS